jgi:MFS superfamily sulfate permease-like transporter
VFTGLRLAAPSVLIHMAKIGSEQLFLFVVTITLTLVEDLLVGIMGGIFAKLIIQLINGAPFSSLFKATAVAHDDGPDTVRLAVTKAAIFSNLFSLKRQIARVDPAKHLTLDFSATRLVDHTVMEYLHGLAQELARDDRRLVVTGLEHHAPLSAHQFAARKRSA